MNIPNYIRMARRVSTPLIAVTTPDQPATISQIVDAYAPMNGNQPPMVCWDIIRGIKDLNEPGEEMINRLAPASERGGMPVGVDPVQALILATKFSKRSILFFCNAQRFMENAAVIQAISNLRNDFKFDTRTLILLGPDIVLPPELTQDVLVIDEPLPNEDRIKAIIYQNYVNAQATKEELPDMSERAVSDCVSALTGLAAFPAEQTFAMGIDLENNCVDIDQMWDRKRGMINQTSGIQMLDNSTLPTFGSIGGLEAAKQFGMSLFNGAQPPRVVVWLDEIEKMFAGLGSDGVGDSSGVSQDQLGVMLREQEFNNWAGLIAVGPPGAGKSHYARALGTSFDVPTILLDLGAMKGSLVGQSEQQVRAALKVIKAVAGTGGAFFVATCNDLTVLPPELRRRYKYGIWFFDLPDKEERESIWKICLEQFGISGVSAERTFDDEGWTGAEIRNVCELAWRLGQSLDQARKNIVPVSISDAGRIAKLRGAAAGKFLSASYPGPYKGEPKAKTGKSRQIFGE
jgi:hypothetical protein